jgi:hypothetical protein
MNYPFKIGETYENMKGAYVVLSISPPKMHIQYEDQSQATVDIGIQARIWERIQDELAFAQQEFERRTAVKRLQILFSGLKDNDFKDNVAGTNWRSREGLAGLVSQQLSDLSGKEYTSVAIYRRPQFFVYPPHLPMFNQHEGVKLPKFVVQLNSEGVLYGFYIEKSDEEMGSDWYWPRFLNLLSETKWQDNLAQIMSMRELSWIMRFEEEIEGANSYKLSPDITISSFGGGSPFPAISDFVAYLHDSPKRHWCNLYLAKYMDRQEAIEMREKISRPISHTFNELIPFFSKLLTLAGMNATM